MLATYLGVAEAVRAYDGSAVCDYTVSYLDIVVYSNKRVHYTIVSNLHIITDESERMNPDVIADGTVLSDIDIEAD